MQKEIKEEFISRIIAHMRRFQDNMIILEINKDKLPFSISDFTLLRESFNHDIDKIKKNTIENQLKITNYWYCYRNKIENENLIAKEEVEQINNEHYVKNDHHIEHYTDSEKISNIALCKMASDMAAICQEYSYESYSTYLLENRKSKFKLLSDTQVITLVCLLDLIQQRS
jgi:hypothetical protein